jgi:hypothetical protein
MSAAHIRPPWPDELPRIQAAFPRLAYSAGLRPLILVTETRPERIVGVVGVTPPAAGVAFLTCSGRHHHSRQPEGRALLDAAVSIARELGATSLASCDDLREGDPRLAWLRNAGFSETHVDELWWIDITTMQQRLEPVHHRLARSGRLAKFAAGSLDAGALPEVRALVGQAGLLSPDRVCLAATPGDPGYDAELSTVVRREGKVVAVLLAKKQGRRAIVEARAVDPRLIGKFNLPNHLCFHRAVGIGLSQGLTELLFTANPAKEAETIRMARRFRGRMLSRTYHVSVTIQPRL